MLKKLIDQSQVGGVFITDGKAKAIKKGRRSKEEVRERGLVLSRHMQRL
jgi:hypothetical protein